jgi:DNA (cytosine-5)-methyltransferase 1
VVENVPGLLSSNGGRDFAVILRGLAQLGYGVCWRVLDAQYFGVAQRRRRVFIVGHLGNGRAAQVLFESESCAWDPAPSRKERSGIARDITYYVDQGGGKGLGRFEIDISPILTESMTAHAIAFQPRYTRNGRGAQCVAIDVRNSREQPDNVSGVLQSKGTGGYSLNYINPIATTFGVRRLTPTECERLQGFPDGHTAGQSDSARYRQLGNAVCVPVAEWLGRRILAADALTEG